MANGKVKFSVSVTPILEVTDAEADGTWSTVAKDVGKTLGGSGEHAVTWGTTIGYEAGVPTYKEITSATSLGTFTSVKFVFIKHTGYSDAAKTTATDKTVSIMESTNQFAVLGPGDAIILPYAVVDTPVLTATSDDASAVQIEVMGQVG